MIRPNTLYFCRNAAADLHRCIALSDAPHEAGAAALKCLREHAPRDLAQALSLVKPADAAAFLNSLPVRRSAELLSLMPQASQLALLSALGANDRERLVRAMPADRLADLFLSMPASARASVMEDLAQEERPRLARLAAYPESTAGAWMTTDYVAVSAAADAAQALARVHEKAPRAEALCTICVVDADGCLLGTASLRDLMLAPSDSMLGDIMQRCPVSVLDVAKDEEAAALLAKYDLDAIPVVDQAGRLAGVITADDALEIDREDAAARLARFGGAGAAEGEDLDYLRTPLRRILSVRLCWLVLLTLFGMATSTFVAAQQALLEKAIILAAFIAPIVDMGGNVGSQSATLVIRSMTLGDVSAVRRDLCRIMLRELPVAAALGVVIGVLEGILAYFTKGLPLDVLAVVVLSMMICTTVGGLAGAGLPFLAKRFGADPATLSSPLITSIMDLIGVAVYFGLAVMILSPERFA